MRRCGVLVNRNVCQGTEFNEILIAFAELDQVTKTLQERGKWQKTMDIPILFIMEFLPGKSHRASLLILLGCTSDEVLDSDLKSESEWGQKALFDLGRILVFDVFINNWDRFPFIWRLFFFLFL